MFAAIMAGAGRHRPKPDLLRDALGRYGRQVRQVESPSGVLLAAEPDASLAARQEHATALHGWIDQPLASVGRPSSAAARYTDAVSASTRDADRGLVGAYAAATLCPDGTLRLARSPWTAPPLYWAQIEGCIIASPLLRVLFAAGVEKQLDYDAIVRELAYADAPDQTRSPYHGISKVPLGTITSLNTAAEPAVDAWYDPLAVAEQSQMNETQRTERVGELLDEAARAALAQADRPALALSGGLDSPLAATALLRALPENATLQTITFRPHDDAETFEDCGNIADESADVRAFAAMHPRLEPHWADPELAGFDYRARDMFEAMHLFAPGLANVGMYHGVYAKARELGNKWLFTASLGNQSFSADGRWAYAEYARSGRFGELLPLLRNRPGDTRSMPRKLLALALLPNLPRGIRRGLRSLVHPARRDMAGLMTPLTAEVRNKVIGSAWDDLHFGTSRMSALAADYADEDSLEADVTLAFEQLYGVRHRDVTAYRPLLEFCAGLPTEAFASGGIERRLAKAMARGMMPEEQRANLRQGRHSADLWWRIGRRRGELLEQCARMREHAWLGRTVDIERLEYLLKEWPEAPGFDMEQDWPRILAIPRAILTAQFIAFAERRNRL